MDRVRPWVLTGIERGRVAWLGAPEAYRRMLDQRLMAEVLEDRQFRFLSQFGAIHHFKREGAYLVTGFEEADRIFREDALFPNVKQTHLDPYDHLLSTTPERHEVTSAMIRACLTKRIFQESSEWVKAMSIRLFDGLPVGRKLDWYRSFAMPAAYFSACRIFGFEDADALAFYRRGDGNLESPAFYQGFREWCTEGLGAEPTDTDERLLNTFRWKVRQGVLTMDEAAELLLVMFHGALKTTAATLCMLCKALITREWGIGPMDLEDEQGLTKYIEEAVRLVPVLPRLVRRVAEDTEVAGVPLRKGSLVCLDVRATNRDGRRFDQPDMAQPDAKHLRHLSFGAGMHQCIGMHLARHNLRTILAPLMGRLGSVRHLASKWATDTHDVYFNHPYYMVCRRDPTRIPTH